jgi:hypothetical protein
MGDRNHYRDRYALIGLIIVALAIIGLFIFVKLSAE